MTITKYRDIELYLERDLKMSRTTHSNHTQVKNCYPYEWNVLQQQKRGLEEFCCDFYFYKFIV